MEYRDAVEVRELAEGRVLPDYHSHLVGCSIAYAFTSKMKSKGREVLAKIKKASSLECFLTGLDVILLVNEPAWDRLSEPQRIALIDHEFCHVAVEDGKVGIVGHDLEEFIAVVERHGLWQPDVEAFGVAAARQLKLEFEDA